MNHSVPKNASNAAGGIDSIIPMSVTWLAWAASARRLCSRYGDTSTAQRDLGLRRAERVAVVHRPVRVELAASGSGSGIERRGCAS